MPEVRIEPPYNSGRPDWQDRNGLPQAAPSKNITLNDLSLVAGVRKGVQTAPYGGVNALHIDNDGALIVSDDASVAGILVEILGELRTMNAALAERLR